MFRRYLRRRVKNSLRPVGLVVMDTVNLKDRQELVVGYSLCNTKPDPETGRGDSFSKAVAYEIATRDERLKRVTLPETKQVVDLINSLPHSLRKIAVIQFCNTLRYQMNRQIIDPETKNDSGKA